MRALVYLLLLVGMAGSSVAQSSLQPCVEIGPLYSTTTSTDTLQAYCISSKPAGSGTSPTHLSGNQRIALHSELGVTLKHGFKAGGFSASGGFAATATANKVDGVVLEPADYDGTACMFEKFEIGLQLPDSVIALIDTFLANGSGGLNPFEPTDVDLNATFFKVGVAPQLANGFYMYDYQLMRNSTTSKAEKVVRQQSNNYPWRVRHAFTESGVWTVNVVASINSGSSIQLANFTVQATDCGNPGYLSIGNEDNYNDHYLRYSHSGEGFFALGYNLDQDKTFSSETAVCSDSTYEYYNRAFRDLAASGANYTRIWANPEMLGPEWKQLGNYATETRGIPKPDSLGALLDHQGMAFVWDHLLELGEQHNIKIQICLETSSHYHGYQWDLYNPYRQELGLPNANAFFTDIYANYNYAKKLRYLVARYGYSTAIASWEFWNEVDEVWHDKRFEQNNQLGGEARTQVRQWHQQMGSYIKNTLNHTIHPLTTSMSFAANYHAKQEMPWTLDEIDIVQYHKYNTDEDAHKDWYNTVNPYVTHDFSANLFPGTGQNRRKPVLLGEAGGNKWLDECYAPAFHNRIWATTFHGTMGCALSWGDVHRTRGDHQYFQPLAAFLDGVDWLSNEWKPDKWHNPSTSPAPFEVYSLSSKDNDRAMGWVANRTFDWANLRDHIPCLSLIIPDSGYTQGDAQNPTTVSGKAMKIHGLSHLPTTKYMIEWYDPATGVLQAITSKRVNGFGQLRPEVQLTNHNQPDWAFKIYRASAGGFKAQPEDDIGWDQSPPNVKAATANQHKRLPIATPNPCNGTFQLQGIPDNAKVNFYDAYGRQITPTVVSKRSYRYQLKPNQKGLYFALVLTPLEKKVIKIIVI